MELFSEIGGRAVGVIGMTGSGKSNLLNTAREKVTRCDDARLVQLNGAHMGDELTWEPVSALTLCGPVATDEEVRSKIAAALEALCLLVTNRSATLAETGHSTFQPTAEDPAVAVIIDEVDEIVKHVPGAGQALEFLASKQRKSAVCLVLATQRAVIAALGGGAVRANMSEVLVGKVARAHRIPARHRGRKGDPRHPRVRQGRARLLPALGPALGHDLRAGPGVPAGEAARRAILVRTGSSRASRYGFASQPALRPRPEPAPARPDGYVTIEALADAVHEGLVDVDDDTRAVLEQVRQIRDPAARRPHLHVVPDPEGDAS
jgi:hypothetical protein